VAAALCVGKWGEKIVEKHARRSSSMVMQHRAFGKCCFRVGSLMNESRAMDWLMSEAPSRVLVSHFSGMSKMVTNAERYSGSLEHCRRSVIKMSR